MAETNNKWVRLSPPFKAVDTSTFFIDYCAMVQAIIQSDGNVFQELRRNQEKYTADSLYFPTEDRLLLMAAGMVLTDLARQKWQIRTKDGSVEVAMPKENGNDYLSEKERVRCQEMLRREEQLRKPSVQRFIQSMEKKRLHNSQFVSIFSLMRDGEELAECILRCRSLSMKSEASLDHVIQPYIQFVTATACCQWTGIRLMDIWRYFRHTWVNQHRKSPGRNMMVLVRDKAVPMHPVIGIAAISSPIIQIRERDLWIGWHPDAFLKKAKGQPSGKLINWIINTVVRAIDETYCDDFIEDGILSVSSLYAPSDNIISDLLQEGYQQRKEHYRFARSAEYKDSKAAKANLDSDHWIKRARGHLFRSKRAFALADLLNSRKILSEHFREGISSDALAHFVKSSEGRSVILKTLRKARADRVGISMADISVCGAIPPYNVLLGGKLVTMLSVSPEVVSNYNLRYQDAKSEIASAMAGRSVVRPSQIVFLGTTSLYGVGSSQYNRVRIPCNLLDGEDNEEIKYEELGRSKAFGTSHISDTTISVLNRLVSHSNDGQRVNSIFGEGVSPKLRKLRNGLDLIGFPSDILLRHGRKRVVYGVPLVRNLLDYLLGIDNTPNYLAPLENSIEKTDKIVKWWMQRWLSKRVQSDDILSQVRAHSLKYPIHHGARVKLPKCE